MKGRRGSSPKRRFASSDRLGKEGRKALAAKLTYTGSAHHKTNPGDYGFQPPVNPRPWKSICDGSRVIRRAEARNLFRRGILLGVFSDFREEEAPKYVWAVDGEGEAYEAKVIPGTSEYKGYRLEEDDAMRDLVLKEWAKRCTTN
ncbi:hypothetical protein IMX07_14095 [bacterium]|nr:hypothetical protein [bacterium]